MCGEIYARRTYPEAIDMEPPKFRHYFITFPYPLCQTIPEAGVIQGQLVVANVSVNKNCIIKDSVILGTITVLNGDNPAATFILDESVVVGRIRIIGGAAVVTNNILSGDNNLVIDSADNDTVLQDNLLQGGGNIIVRGSLAESALVIIDSNTVTHGDIRCINNADPATGAVDAFARDNIVPRGKITCFGQ